MGYFTEQSSAYTYKDFLEFSLEDKSTDCKNIAPQTRWVAEIQTPTTLNFLHTDGLQILRNAPQIRSHKQGTRLLEHYNTKHSNHDVYRI